MIYWKRIIFRAFNQNGEEYFLRDKNALTNLQVLSIANSNFPNRFTHVEQLKNRETYYNRLKKYRTIANKKVSQKTKIGDNKSLLVHHIDKNELNNDPSNIISVEYNNSTPEENKRVADAINYILDQIDLPILKSFGPVDIPLHSYRLKSESFDKQDDAEWEQEDYIFRYQIL